MNRALPIGAMLLAVTGLTGCSGFRAPGVVVSDAFVAETSDEAVTLGFAMDLRNPNPLPLELFEFRYTLAVQGVKVYAGRRAGAETIGARSAQSVTIPAVIPDDLAGWSASGRPAEVEYTLTGRVAYFAPAGVAQVLFDAGLRRPKVNFTKRGRVRLQ